MEILETEGSVKSKDMTSKAAKVEMVKKFLLTKQERRHVYQLTKLLDSLAPLER